MHKALDPRDRGPKPPFPAQKQEFPGSDAALDPKADHGEDSYVGTGRLAGMRVLITGGDSGIGRAVAIAFAREGADLLISYYDEDEDAKETARHVEQAGRKALLAPGDIQSAEHCEKLVQRAVAELGGLDVLINNAAFQRDRDHITDIPPGEFERTLQTNVVAMYHLCKAAVPHMGPGSSIINTSSIQASQPSPSLLAYATTKGAIDTFSKSLAVQLAPQGIRVNVVAPGPVWTPFIPMSTPQAEGVKDFGADAPLGNRPAQPREVAPVFVFLASPDASYVTGMVYGVTGGELMH